MFSLNKRYSMKWSCLTLNTFICQRKSQNVLKKKMTSKKCANVGGGKCAKSWLQNPRKSKQFSRVKASTDSHGIIKIPTGPPSGLE